MTEESGFQLQRQAAETYEACWVSAQMARCAEDLVRAVAIARDDAVLDVACGTGVVARTVAKRAGQNANVTGTDLNGSMLSSAQAIAAEAGFPGIRWVECDAANMPFDDGAFDVAFCQQGLQFMPDRPAALAEMARVLAPGGRLAVSVWKSVSPLGRAFSNVLDRRFGEGTSAPWQQVYALGDREELRGLVADAGFKDIYIELDVKFCRHGDPVAFVSGALAGSPLAGLVAAMPETDRRRLVEDIITEIGDHRDDGGLAVPAACHTLTART